MGILNFLKPKKSRDAKDDFSSLGSLGDLGNIPQMPPVGGPEQKTYAQSEQELYSELPSLPEAPDTLGLPEIELPPPLKENLDDSAFSETKTKPWGFGPSPEDNTPVKKPKEIFDIGRSRKETPKEDYRVEPLLPNWPDTQKDDAKMAEVPDLFSIGMDKSGQEETRSDIPELKQFMPRLADATGTGGKLVSHNNSFFLKADDFRVIQNNLNELTGTQKKHHKLTEIKKEENLQYEKMNAMVEDMQRKLTHIDRTLFE